MVRNLKQGNVWPPRPMRSCLNKTGPRETNRIIPAVAKARGINKGNAKRISPMSSARFQRGVREPGIVLLKVLKAPHLLFYQLSLRSVSSKEQRIPSAARFRQPSGARSSARQSRRQMRQRVFEQYHCSPIHLHGRRLSKNIQ